MKNPIDRRTFLSATGAAAAAAALGPRLEALGRPPVERSLVLLQLAGGNDGLSTVVPFADQNYIDARPDTGLGADEVLPIADGVGLHGELRGLHRLFDEGQLAIVQGVGYPHPNRSHFKSFDIWHAADRRGRGVLEGWIGRLMGAAYGERTHPNRVIHLGGRVPYALHSSSHPPASFSTPEGYRWVKNEDEVRAVEERLRRADEAGGTLSFLRGVMADAQASSRDVRSAVARYLPAVKYPRDRFADQLRTAAALLNGNLGTRVISLELGGFDTHNEQKNRHARLMRTLDGGLSAFLRDLQATEAGRQTVVLAFSEFGRRVAENGSGGTDHGTAGPAFLAGAPVQGGLFGNAPVLTDLDEGDLVFTTPFQNLYATVIEGCFGVSAADVLGEGFSALPILEG